MENNLFVLTFAFMVVAVATRTTTTTESTTDAPGPNSINIQDHSNSADSEYDQSSSSDSIDDTWIGGVNLPVWEEDGNFCGASLCSENQICVNGDCVCKAVVCLLSCMNGLQIDSDQCQYCECA